MHGDALHVISSLGIWRIKDDGRRLVPDMLKPLLWEGQKVEACCPWSIFQCPLTQRSFQHGRISLALSLNKNQVLFSHSARFCIASSSTLNMFFLQFLLLCATAAGTGGTNPSRQQLLVLDANDGRIVWTVPFSPSTPVSITCAW